MLNNCTQADEEAVCLILAHRTMLRAYIGSIVFDRYEAEETFSEVVLAILRSWNRYDPAFPFPPWARGVARRVALSHLRKLAREPACWAEDVQEDVGLEIDALGDEPAEDARKEALQGCIQGLQAPHSELIYHRYFDDRSYSEISGMVGRTVANLYVTFNRLHNILSVCIQKKMGRL